MSTIERPAAHPSLAEPARGGDVARRKFAEHDEAAALHALFVRAFDTAAKHGRTRLGIANALGVDKATVDYWAGPNPDRAFNFEAVAVLLRCEHVLGPAAHALLRAGVLAFMHGGDADTVGSLARESGAREPLPADPIPSNLLPRAGCAVAGSAGALAGLIGDVTDPHSEDGAAISPREADHVRMAAGDVIEDAQSVSHAVGRMAEGGGR